MGFVPNNPFIGLQPPPACVKQAFSFQALAGRFLVNKGISA
jgi:hypothetical protein